MILDERIVHRVYFLYTFEERGYTWCRIWFSFEEWPHSITGYCVEEPCNCMACLSMLKSIEFYNEQETHVTLKGTFGYAATR